MTRALVLRLAQGLVALIFVTAGGMKLLIPVDALQMPVPMPDPLLQALGVVEIFGAVCLVVPHRLGAHPRLTSLAATGLTMIGMGAAAVTVLAEGMAEAAFPTVVALLAALVAVGRRPRRGRA